MDLRKFYFYLTIIVAIVLFLSGIGIIYYVNSTFLVSDASTINSGNSFNQLLEPLIQKKEPFNVLLLGGDKVNKNTDTIMLANFDPATCKVNIMSIPRDTKVTIENKERKINYAFPHGGINLTVKTVSELLDVNIKYYAFIDTAAFREIIDLLGGVDYYILADMDYDDPTQNLHIHLKKGQQRLNGSQAEQFIRFRHPNTWTKEIRKYYDGSDLKRTEAQQNFLKELMRQKLNIQYLPKLNSIIDSVFNNVETNFTLNEIVKLTGYVGKFKMENVSFIPMPGTTYDASPWYYLCDVESARQIMSEKFICNDSFVEIDQKNKSSYKSSNNSTKANNTSAKNTNSNSNNTKSGESTDSKPKNGTQQNNPSNADTSIKGSDQDP